MSAHLAYGCASQPASIGGGGTALNPILQVGCRIAWSAAALGELARFDWGCQLLILLNRGSGR
jgi:hypothetical protein